MGNLPSLSDEDLERLLAGRELSDEGELDELAAFWREAAALLPEAPDRATAERHIAAMMATAQQVSEVDNRDSTPSVTPSRADRKAPRFRTRRNPVFRNPLSGLAGKLALVAILVLAAFGGTAYAGALPDGVQDAVGDVADSLGVSLPGADDSDDDAVEDVDEGALDDSDDVTVDDQGDDYPDRLATVEDDQGDDDQGANEDDQGDLGANEDDQGDVDQDDQGDVDQDDQSTIAEDDQGEHGDADEGEQGGAGEDSDDQDDGDEGGSLDDGDEGDGDEGEGNN